MTGLRLAVIGLGKIARDQHLPTIAALPAVKLAAVADPHVTLAGVPAFASLEELLRNGPPVDAVALCTPPQMRGTQAAIALAAGKHVLLEKPPAATISAIGPLVGVAGAAGLTLFATWHARFAPAVEPARTWLASREIRAVRVIWKEDVRVWHPGQAWIWEAGGFGVFDPGINALSILTRVLPRPFFLTDAELSFPDNRAAPIAARLAFSDAGGLAIEADFDFRQTGEQTWAIEVDTDHGRLTLSAGGARLSHDGQLLIDEKKVAYPLIYRRFVDLIARSESDVDLAPLAHVADAFMLGRRVVVEPFED
ncbi:Gfo/Idh/MocA family oxidoreductase [Bradyrhizobium sp. U87765 SZCCT0131]|uniref:Gfo/Idh/MocA family protein n=1 Tax=unclassified Bradyrhizobium TaxID=2631580 RepID=UPI001BACE1DE|nr:MULTISPECIES: Gfo/Idh/MocA family oxidoreductase [unclassified Bradyrhizobium]MBR1221242.1 Gfo/Idh/MocA family oxidoreductase [Bradyrhizobium sp. U87765 SZCCT0131]MBR1259937.1 Gfo/Idh/MocA family oxidoreductase [Bradyrhizobium sp. U87765 SZCCT0134]MBR1307814.1 Gfo/Idh/MocA family oxidoreductase [Bradyrhizobium sp. U87765 SZCCT0110]MBR1321768.1 Gfo/Idh/MocA family oxidoreductase [Bradyrhizobium sp. U87765 SZCCT0109]MBR1350080.1 Gfo/Idh/MocA family oxidoreductase [Bradyrhizobium sp. U87765 SZ